MDKLKLNTEKIKSELIRVGWTFSDLARKMGVTRQAVSSALKNKPITQAAKFADALGMDAKDLIK